MAEIKDIYTLEFNAATFSAEIDAAIGKIDELNATIEDSADSVNDLEAAQQQLTAVLGTEAKTVQDLNSKRNTLVQTQSKLNKESKTGVAVTNEVNNTTKKLATETGNAVKSQKSLAGQFMSGVRSINSMKRAAGLLMSGFRLLAAALPFGLIMAALPGVVSMLSSMFGVVDKNAVAMEKLKDESLGYGERLTIIQDELDRLNTLEARRGYLTEEEKKQREELTAKYKETADQIIKIEEDRVNRQQELELQLKETRVKLLGDTVAGAVASAELEEKKLLLNLSKRRDQILDDSDKLFKELKDAQAEYDATSSTDANIRAIRIQNALDRNFQEETNLIEEQNLQLLLIEREKNEKIQRLVDEANAKKLAAEKAAIEERERAMWDEYQFKVRVAEFEEEMSKKAFEERQKQTQAEKDEFKKMWDDHYADIEKLKAGYDKASQYRQNNAETNLNIALLSLEAERNAELLAAFGNAELQAEIDAEYNAKRLAFEKQTSAEILKVRIEFLEKLRDASQDDPLLTSELNKTIAELKLKLEELGKAATETGDKVKKKLSPKELFEETSKLIQQSSDAVFDVLNAQLDAYTANLDKAIDKSKSTLDEIRANSENFNARQLELERDRLEKLQEERRKAIEKEKALALIQLTINSTLAIAKAAAEGGAAAPFTIASTIIALIAGFATARAAASSAFFEGSEYVDKQNRYPAGRDTVPARLNKGERVITTETNSKYWDALSAIHNGKVSPEAINGFVNGTVKMSDPVFLSDYGIRPIIVNSGSNNSGLESRLERIENALLDLPKFMPHVSVNANANGIFKIVERRQNAKQFSRKRAM